MPTINPQTRFDWILFKPVSIVLLALSIFMLFNKSWVIAALMLALWFSIGMVAQSFHSKTNNSNLRNGTYVEDEFGDPNHFYNNIVKAISSTKLICGIAVLLLLIFFNFSWWLAFLFGFLVYLIFPMPVGIILKRAKLI